MRISDWSSDVCSSDLMLSMSTPDFTSKAWFSIDELQRAFERRMTATDPVCGKQIDIESAVAQEDHNGWMHFFCSTVCQNRYRKTPQHYTGQQIGRAHV